MTITGTPEEIAALALKIQERTLEIDSLRKMLQKSVDEFAFRKEVERLLHLMETGEASS